MCLRHTFLFLWPIEFLYYLMWNHHGKCIQISTNIPGIGSLIREIDVKISEI